MSFDALFLLSSTDLVSFICLFICIAFFREVFARLVAFTPFTCVTHGGILSFAFCFASFQLHLRLGFHVRLDS